MASSDEQLVFGDTPEGVRPVWPAIWRGFKKQCPACGTGSLFKKFTTNVESCSHCQTEFTGHRADDGPPYFTIMIVGHITIPLVLEAERHLDPPIGLQMLFWTIVLVVMTWLLLPRTKGALIGLQWAKKMHGFGEESEEEKNPGAVTPIT